MGNTQKHLIGALRDVTDREGGVAARVESTNRQIVQTLERRTKALDELLHEFKTDLLRTQLRQRTKVQRWRRCEAFVAVLPVSDSAVLPAVQAR